MLVSQPALNLYLNMSHSFIRYILSSPILLSPERLYSQILSSTNLKYSGLYSRSFMAISFLFLDILRYIPSFLFFLIFYLFFKSICFQMNLPCRFFPIFSPAWALKENAKEWPQVCSTGCPSGQHWNQGHGDWNQMLLGLNDDPNGAFQEIRPRNHLAFDEHHDSFKIGNACTLYEKWFKRIHTWSGPPKSSVNDCEATKIQNLCMRELLYHSTLQCSAIFCILTTCTNWTLRLWQFQSFSSPTIFCSLIDLAFLFLFQQIMGHLLADQASPGCQLPDP